MSSVRNVGVLFDSGLTMEAQVAQIAKSSYYQIRNIGQIRSSITDDACKTMVHVTLGFWQRFAARPSADDAAAYATCAKLRSPPRFPHQ